MTLGNALLEVVASSALLSNSVVLALFALFFWAFFRAWVPVMLGTMAMWEGVVLVFVPYLPLGILAWTVAQWLGL